MIIGDRVMARLETAHTRGLRDFFGFYKSFDVALACPFEDVEIPDDNLRRKTFDFYDSIGNMVKKLGKRPYLPHREIDLNWEPRKIFRLVNEIVIPMCDIVLTDVHIPSHAAGIMMGSAVISRIPLIYFYDEYADLETLKVNVTEISSLEAKSYIKDWGFDSNTSVVDLIESQDNGEKLSRLEISLKKFYETYKS
ncbi:MAG: hypothetical protein RL557_593 [archaeon]|jgi:hypothetical protein